VLLCVRRSVPGRARQLAGHLQQRLRSARPDQPALDAGRRAPRLRQPAKRRGWAPPGWAQAKRPRARAAAKLSALATGQALAPAANPQTLSAPATATLRRPSRSVRKPAARFRLARAVAAPPGTNRFCAQPARLR